MEKLQRKRARIGSLTGIKVLATAGIFYWHAFPHSGTPDLGARICELFFVLSGFLVAYNGYGRMDNTITGAFRYVRRKLVSIYPPYVLALLLVVISRCLQGGGWFDVRAACSGIWCLFLQQAWIPEIAMDYDGAAWFISALLFCYACVPVFGVVVHDAEESLGRARGRIALFAVALLLRVFLEECASLGGVFPISIHCSPLVRAPEFFMAFIAGALFTDIRDYGESSDRHGLMAFSALELMSLAVSCWCVMNLDAVWPRWAFTLLFIVAVLPFAFDFGVLSKILSVRPLVLASRIELHFYLLHQPVIWLVGWLFSAYSLGGWKKVALCSFLITASVSGSFQLGRQRFLKYASLVHK